ncbi:hypothetical protein PCC7418_2883 [Halothece sp. PCC 7418]|uniref:hypothetical protein n=1 Tax=Halothece sp. (strain PCC 7418) TaxID=65093 RepID=UPI0002A0603E|nr:hypothetical protein [Halothece sp. PCC 7418]AFZ45013.1 hypothetical protein PCC7418_2883 [Halothece sp. PCC 7418]
MVLLAKKVVLKAEFDSQSGTMLKDIKPFAGVGFRYLNPTYVLNLLSVNQHHGLWFY